MRTLTKAWIQKAWYVYDYMSAAGILSAGDAGIIRNGSTAKGTFYSVFETGEADGNTYENRLVYDRVSENGQCDLFVYEQLVSGSDTRLLGFYAVNKTTNEVFSADRNSWGGVSSRGISGRNRRKLGWYMSHKRCTSWLSPLRISTGAIFLCVGAKSGSGFLCLRLSICLTSKSMAVLAITSICWYRWW